MTKFFLGKGKVVNKIPHIQRYGIDHSLLFKIGIQEKGYMFSWRSYKLHNYKIIYENK